MARELSNSHMFFAYHIRSAFLMSELALRDMLSEKDMSPENFYVLRCDWKAADTAFDDIKAHALLSAEEVIKSVNDLIIKGYVKKGAEEGFYSLSLRGKSVRTQLLEAYHAQISKSTEGLSELEIETALSGLLTVQNNIQQN